MEKIEHVAFCDFIDEHAIDFYESVPVAVLENVKIQIMDMSVEDAARVVWCFFPASYELSGETTTPNNINADIVYRILDILDNIK